MKVKALIIIIITGLIFSISYAQKGFKSVKFNIGYQPLSKINPIPMNQAVYDEIVYNMFLESQQVLIPDVNDNVNFPNFEFSLNYQPFRASWLYLNGGISYSHFQSKDHTFRFVDEFYNSDNFTTKEYDFNYNLDFILIKLVPIFRLDMNKFILFFGTGASLNQVNLNQTGVIVDIDLTSLHWKGNDYVSESFETSLSYTFKVGMDYKLFEKLFLNFELDVNDVTTLEIGERSIPFETGFTANNRGNFVPIYNTNFSRPKLRGVNFKLGVQYNFK